MSVITINSFLTENLWIYHLVLVILAILIIYFLILIRRTNTRRNFLARLSREQGPLAPRNLLPTLIDSLPDFIYIKDKKGKFIIANQKLADTVGEYKGEMLVGWLALLPGYDELVELIAVGVLGTVDADVVKAGRQVLQGVGV